MGSYIKAISYYLPERALTNDELAAMYPEFTAAEILRRSGVAERHISADGELPSDMAVKAAEIFFNEHGIDRKDIDFLLFCTTLLDRQSPATANLLQHRIGLNTNIGALDIPLGSSGFIHGLLVAKSLIAGKAAKNVLLLAGDCATKTIHPSDYELKVLFGDAMSATLISESSPQPPSPDPIYGEKGIREGGISSFVIGSDGGGADDLIISGCNNRETASREWLDEYKENGGMPYGRLYMDGMGVLGFTLKNVPEMVKELLEKENIAMNDIDMFIFHQAGGFILESLKKKLRIPDEKYFINISHKGNTVSATIPLALYDAIDAGKIKKGNKVLLAGFGIGFSWGATIITI
jgi:3-oxoacyl-[acyl-carrier-protein] synthase III